MIINISLPQAGPSSSMDRSTVSNDLLQGRALSERSDPPSGSSGGGGGSSSTSSAAEAGFGCRPLPLPSHLSMAESAKDMALALLGPMQRQQWGGVGGGGGGGGEEQPGLSTRQMMEDIFVSVQDEVM